MSPTAGSPTGVLSERSGETQPQVGGLLGRLTRIVRANFERNNWPLDVEGRASEPDRSWIAHYRMTADAADWWKASYEPGGTSARGVD